MFPDLRVIVMARDGRDSCSSAIKRGSEPLAAFAMWLERMSACVHVLERGDVPSLLVRYEDLIADPEVTIRRACEFLELEFSDELMHPERNEFWKSHKFHKTWGSSPTSGQFSARSVGQYKKRLTPGELALFWSLRLTERGTAHVNGSHASPAAIMRALGYESDPGEETQAQPAYDPLAAHTAQMLAEGYVRVQGSD